MNIFIHIHTYLHIHTPMHEYTYYIHIPYHTYTHTTGYRCIDVQKIIFKIRVLKI